MPYFLLYLLKHLFIDVLLLKRDMNRNKFYHYKIEGKTIFFLKKDKLQKSHIFKKKIIIYPLKVNNYRNLQMNTII